MMQRFEINVALGYITWCWAKDLEAAKVWADKRYGHIVPKDEIVVKGPLPEEEEDAN